MEWMQDIAGHVTDYGVPAFMLVYLLAVMLPVPAWPVTVAAGVMFGLVKGLAFALVMNFVGSVGAFLVSRYLLRHSVEKIIKRRPKLKAVDEAMREGGWKAVALLQMSPAVPFGLQNYFLGASKVKVGAYLIGTAITGVPSTVIYVSAGAGGRLVSGLDGSMKWVAIVAGLAVTIGLSIWISRLARKRLARA